MFRIAGPDGMGANWDRMSPRCARPCFSLRISRPWYVYKQGEVVGIPDSIHASTWTNCFQLGPRVPVFLFIPSRGLGEHVKLSLP